MPSCEALGAANLEPPRFDDRRSSFRVVFHNHTLMSPEAISWLNQFAPLPLNDRQRVALVYLRQHGEIANPQYRRLNRVDALTAGQELRGIVQQGLAAQHGVGRWTTYSLAVEEGASEEGAPRQPSDEERILDYVGREGSIRNEVCREILDVGVDRASYLLRRMLKAELLVREGKGRWARYRLP